MAIADPAPTVAPSAATERVVYLIEACSGVERRLLRRWIAEKGAPNAQVYELPPSRGLARLFGLRRAVDPRLANSLEGADVSLRPLRIAWLPVERDGRRTATWWDLLTFTDPRDPDLLRQWWLAARRPDRWSVVTAEPATLAQVRQRWVDAGGDATDSLARFVARTALLALERAERGLRGARSKVPRFVLPEITHRRAYREAIAALARELGRPEPKVAREAEKCLKEIAATHSAFVIDLVQRAIKLAWSQGYRALEYDPQRLAAIYEHAARAPLVFLPTHKSNLDHAVMQYVLHENGRPPNHTAGGINMNFFPIGPLFRRTGVFFIRRTFKDQPVYKMALRQYVDFLVEKRFPMEWYMEGGRSRSGKLLPPRLGLLAYVVDAWRRGKSEDVLLVPVSIAYDQISDVGDYVHEGQGGAKQKESIGWFVRMLQNLRRRYGRIHLRFGEPVSLVAMLGAPTKQISATAPPAGDEDGKGQLDVAKLAFEVAVRINAATPVTPTALVATALLEQGDRAVTVEEACAAIAPLADLVTRRSLPVTAPPPKTPAEVTKVLRQLRDNGVLGSFEEGPEPVWRLEPDQELAAGYYRNTIVHFLVPGAIAELALLGKAPLAEETARIRDLLKFEFFFADRETFRREIEEELADMDSDWKLALAQPDGAARLLRASRPLRAHLALRPFLESYLLVAESLLRLDGGTGPGEDFLARTLALGRQYRMQRRVRSPEAVSKVLFATALKLAESRGAAKPGQDTNRKRRAFADEVRELLQRIEIVSAIAEAKRAGLEG